MRRRWAWMLAAPEPEAELFEGLQNGTSVQYLSPRDAQRSGQDHDQLVMLGPARADPQRDAANPVSNPDSHAWK